MKSKKIMLKRTNDRAIVPKISIKGDASFEIKSTSIYYNLDNDTITYGTGIAVKIPEGYVGILTPATPKNKHNKCVGETTIINPSDTNEIKISYRYPFNCIAKVSMDKETKRSLRDGILKYSIAGEVNGCVKISAFGVPIYKIGDNIANLSIVEAPKMYFKIVDEL